MAGFIIGTTEVTDPATLAEYLNHVGPIIEQYGGTYVAAGPNVHVLEGNLAPNAAAIIAFDTADAARRWYESPDYAEIRRLRHRSGHTEMILLDSDA